MDVRSRYVLILNLYSCFFFFIDILWFFLRIIGNQIIAKIAKKKNERKNSLKKRIEF